MAGVGMDTPATYATLTSSVSVGGARRGAGTIDLTIDIGRVRAWTVVTVAGELDLYTAETLRDSVYGLIEDGIRQVAIDLTEVSFIDSTGLGVLVALLKQLRERSGELALVAPEPSPLTKLIALTGLKDTLPSHDSLADVVGA